jgi:hypothetical protein
MLAMVSPVRWKVFQMNKSYARSTGTLGAIRTSEGVYSAFPGEKSGIVYQHDLYRWIDHGPFQPDLPSLREQGTLEKETPKDQEK